MQVRIENDIINSGTTIVRFTRSQLNAMNALHMIPEMIQVLQLYPLLLALGMLAEDQILALHLLHFPQMLPVEMVVYYCRSAVQERPLFVRLPFVSNVARILRLSYKKGEGVRPGRLPFY